jgi:hypothetical protein
MWRDLDKLERRLETAVAELSQRITHLDEHGSRGVDALRTQFATLQRDLTEHEQLHAEQARQQLTARRFMIGTVVGLVVPLYPLLGWLIRLIIGQS